MPALTPRQALRILQFDSFEPGLVQAVFSRHGGVSPQPWASLNLGGTVGDDPANVVANRLKVFSVMQRDPLSLFDVWQVHGTQVAIGDAPRPPHVPPQQADVILTDQPGVTLMMRFADCVPIFLHDPRRRVVGLAHAGWMGTVRRTVRFAVDAMHARYGSRPADIRAAIGPSIGPDHYEIGEDVASQVRQSFGGDSAALLTENGDHLHFDLWTANRLLLEQSGVHHIELSGVCTACSTADWFSHRAEKGRTGRFGAMLALGA